MNGPRGACCTPLGNPRGPAGKSVLRTALAYEFQPAARRNSRLLGPSMGLAPSGPTQALFKIAPGNFVLSRFASIRHPWRIDLVFRATARRFPAGTTPFQSHWFLLLTKRPHGFWWRLNRRSVSRRPGQPTGMWAEGAVYRDVNLRPTRSRRE